MSRQDYLDDGDAAQAHVMLIQGSANAVTNELVAPENRHGGTNLRCQCTLLALPASRTGRRIPVPSMIDLTSALHHHRPLGRDVLLECPLFIIVVIAGSLSLVFRFNLGARRPFVLSGLRQRFFGLTSTECGSP